VNNVNVTANSEHYPDMLQNFPIPKLQRRDVQQHDFNRLEHLPHLVICSEISAVT